MARFGRRSRGALLLALGAVAAFRAGQSFVSGSPATLPRAGQADSRQLDVQRLGGILQVPGDIKNGKTILLDGQPWVIKSFQSKKIGKGVAITKCQVKNILTGAMVEKALKSGQKVEEVETVWSDATYSYYSEDTSNYVFMDTETFEESMLPQALLGDSSEWLTDGVLVEVEKYEDRYINFRFKGDIIIEVVSTTDTSREDGDQQVVLANGVTKAAPGYIKQGDMVLIDPNTFAIKKRVT